MDSNQDLETLIKELTELKEKYVDAGIAWYQNHSRTPRILFRVAGSLLVLLSVSVPFLVSMKFEGSEIVLSGVALLIAALTGISSFAQWDSHWRGYKQAQLTLESLNASWEMRIVEARHMENLPEARRAVMDATRQLLESSRTLVSSEAERFFENIRTPQFTQKSQ